VGSATEPVGDSAGTASADPTGLTISAGPTSAEPSSGALEAARAASRRRAWAEAVDLFEQAEATGPLDGADLEALAEAAWFTARAELSIEVKERAFRAHQAAGDRSRAAFVAIDLARQYWSKGEPSVASGWLRRAERLLDGIPESFAHGHLALARSHAASASGDLDAALRYAEEAVAIGGRTLDADLQATGLMSLGMLRVSRGDTNDGLGLMEEATIAAVNDELSPFVAGITYCTMIGVCRDLNDHKRAIEWTQAAERWCRRQSVSGFPGICRVHRAEMTALRGAWEQATGELEQATRELAAYNAGPPMADGFYALGEIKLRMGDLAGAEEALRQAHGLGRDPEPALALLRLAQGKPAAALSAISAALTGRAWDMWAKVRLLPAQVEIAVASGDGTTAREAAEELVRVGEAYPSPTLTALIHDAFARVALADGDPARAATELRRAVTAWQEVAAPYEVARSRALLGTALLALHDDEEADLELTAARDEFARLGARPALTDVERTIATAADRQTSAETVRRTFLFTDIEGSTSLAGALGDAAWRGLLQWHDDTLRAVFARHGGIVVNPTGDGFFVAFESASAALDAAIAIQRALADHRRRNGFAPPVRIGLHTAEAARRGADYSGVGVHVAARVAAVAAGGEIVATTTTLEEAPGAATATPREVMLKGLNDPVGIATVRWD
jgi:class 3 adenylate cyclase